MLIPQPVTVAVTGASGLLGRAVFSEFTTRGYNVVGTALTRSKAPLRKLDLTDFDAVEKFVREVSPAVIVHCAAERRPDVCENNKEATLKLNAELPEFLAKFCSSSSSNTLLVYISSDYVFDGKNPPYEAHSKPNPLNFYGMSKLRGEEAVLDSSAKAISLRVPVLYGASETEDESAVNVLVKAVKNPKPSDMDDYAIRYPTNVSDVARIIAELSVRHIAGHDVSGIRNFSADEKMTKYQICSVFAKVLNLPLDHLKQMSDAPVGASANRPYDCHLSNKSLEILGIDTTCVRFEDWWRTALK